MLYGREHVEKYRETGGELGHEWRPGVFTLLLTTTGNKSGNPYTTPVIYGQDGSDYIVVASKGGDDEHPDWRSPELCTGCRSCSLLWSAEA